MNDIYKLLVIATLILFSGCARVGHDFDAQNVNMIMIGKTSQSEIVQMFGKPWRKGIENGVTMWTYGRYTYRVVGQADTKDLVIKFNDKNIVKSYTFNETVD
ncbi:MAG: hypothetical protein L3J10_06210 [Sulfurimonas sp.]|nr:hypothetical protein [Sulfurimonas sp.]